MCDIHSIPQDAMKEIEHIMDYAFNDIDITKELNRIMNKYKICFTDDPYDLLDVFFDYKAPCLMN